MTDTEDRRPSQMNQSRRAEIADLFNASCDAWGKYSRNCNKLVLMSMTNAGRFSFEAYGDQIETYRKEANAARDAFTAAAKHLSAEDLSSIISEALEDRDA